CVDTSFFNPNNINSELSLKKRQVLGLKNDDLVLGYVGSIGTWYLLSEMLDFFKVLKTYRKEAKFLFITQESHVNILLPAHEKGLNKEDLFIISGKRQEMPELISLMDFGIFFIKPFYSKMASSPTKQGEMMAMGKAVICNEGIGDTDMIINQFNAGIVVKNYDYKSAIEVLLKSKFDSSSIRQGAKDYFSLEDGIKKYQSVYEKLVS
ncbi:MAG: glycosyltransferase, partial [Oligoflexus sp.]|nr:glycosyltransferase [Pseudopedobacter sp.]